MKKKICVVIINRANYARIKYFLLAANKNKKIKLQIILGASANLKRFGDLSKIIKKDGLNVIEKVYTSIEGENPTTMAKSTGLATIELASCFDKLKPDIVLTVADRYETISTAIAASYMNIKLAHTQGGEVTGSIDENVRHAITKLSHIHFVSNKKAYSNVLKMGEEKKRVFITGCPSIDILKNLKIDKIKNQLKKKNIFTGTGTKFDFLKRYIIVMQHPVTTEYSDAKRQILETIKAIDKLSTKIQVLWLWPNIDAGSDIFSKQIRLYRETKKPTNIYFHKNFTPEHYAYLLKNALCIVGNSSSAIREGSYLGVPAVNIGNRQQGREVSANVLHSKHNSEQIYQLTLKQIKKKKFKVDRLYGDGTAGKKISDILSSYEFNIHKKLTY
jgi:UDP-hydrolysing UDP-N-acetyl-D-glucosamine 2-epimerase